MARKLAVVISDACHLVNAGGEIQKIFRSFDMPEGMEAFISSRVDGNGYTSVSIAIEDDGKKEG